jgi:hypothetical protein
MNEKEIAAFLEEHIMIVYVKDDLGVTHEIPMEIPTSRKVCVNTFKPKKEKNGKA